MKLKEQTFAIIAEKQNSISHNWFNQFTKSGNKFAWWRNDIYVMNQGTTKHVGRSMPTNMNIYTESEFEALLKAEELSGMITEFMKKAEILTESQINTVLSWMNTWEQLRDTAIPLRFREDFKNKLKAEQYSEKQIYKRLDEIIVPQIIELNQFKADNPNATEKEIDKKLWDLAKKYFNALLTQNKAEQENEAKEITKEFKDDFAGGNKTGDEIKPKLTDFISEKPEWAKPKSTLRPLNEFSPLTAKVFNTERHQVIFTYQTAIDLLAYYTKIDKGIIKIEMP